MPSVMLAIGVAVSATEECCWCDKSTPSSAKTIVGSNNENYKLVFSDEFDDPDRDFANGRDTKWTALNVGDTSNQGVAFYLPSQATVELDTNVTGQPVSALLIKTEDVPHTGDSPTGETGVTMPHRSAMLQTFNKFCFTSGIVEFRARQPSGTGYWPALWLFGNLGRAVYQNSNTGLWPWSYDSCDPDLKLPPADPVQRISACDDHDLATEGIHGFQGRGATELDVMEGAVTNSGVDSYTVGSLQLSPGVPPYFRPPFGGYPTVEGPGSWYSGLSFGKGGTPYTDGFVNNGWYGPAWESDCPTGCPDALSGGLVGLDDLHTRYWDYRIEWEAGPHGHLAWYYDGAFVWGMSAESFGAYSECSERGGIHKCTRTPARQIPAEPMSLVMNTAIGSWNGGSKALDGKHWPAHFWVDYVRVWQRETSVGCNPPDFPTKVYIEKNAELYGEPVRPSGYETCPEIYPPSAYLNAARITARAEAERIKRRAQRLVNHTLSTLEAPPLPHGLLTAVGAGTSLSATRSPGQAAGAATDVSAFSTDGQHGAEGWAPWLAIVGAGGLLVAVVLAALHRRRRVAAYKSAAYPPADIEYEVHVNRRAGLMEYQEVRHSASAA